jgi:hypothetical protein
MKMIMKTLYLSEKQIEYFEKESERLKIKTSELIRRALDKYIESEEDK